MKRLKLIKLTVLIALFFCITSGAQNFPIQRIDSTSAIISIEELKYAAKIFVRFNYQTKMIADYIGIKRNLEQIIISKDLILEEKTAQIDLLKTVNAKEPESNFLSYLSYSLGGFTAGILLVLIIGIN